MSNRQIEKEVRETLPPVRKKTLVLVLENELLDVWEQTREACERLAGKTLTDREVFDLMCAEVLCTFAATPPFDPEDEEDGGFVRSIAERDGWKCTRPGCSCRSGLQGNHIIPRSQGGPDEDWNKHTVCAACHLAITEGRLKVSGRAPDELTWEGPFGVIEKPLPLSGTEYKRQSESNGATGAREVMSGYGILGRSAHQGKSDHVITQREGDSQASYRIFREGILGKTVSSVSGNSPPT
jgi:hypothetical protein